MLEEEVSRSYTQTLKSVTTLRLRIDLVLFWVLRLETIPAASQVPEVDTITADTLTFLQILNHYTKLLLDAMHFGGIDHLIQKE